jgi:MFS family permease
MGVYAAMSGAGGALGLLLGGILTDIASWRWVLFVNVPIGAVVAVTAPLVLGRSAQRGGKLDVPGAFAATAGTTALVYGLVRAPVQGWADPVTGSSFAVAAVLLLAFVTIEARSDHPILPFRLLADRNRATSYLVMLGLAGSIFAVSFFLTQLLQTVFGYSPLRTGALFLPFSVGIVGTSEAVAKLIGRVRPRVFATVGPLLAAVALLWLSRVDPPAPTSAPYSAHSSSCRLGLGSPSSRSPSAPHQECRRPTWALPLRSSTPRSRSAERSGSPSSSPWRPRRPDTP